MIAATRPIPPIGEWDTGHSRYARLGRGVIVLGAALTLWLGAAHGQSAVSGNAQGAAGANAGHASHASQSAPGTAAGGAPGAGDSPYRALSAGSCQEPTLSCARAATPYFDREGALWLVWSAGGAVSVARSGDLGATFGPRVEIAQHGGTLDTGPDARPQIAGDERGNMIIAYGFFRDKQWNAQVNVASSHDHGRSFSSPRSVTDDGTSQRFPSLAVDAGGKIFLTWIDKRQVAAAVRGGGKKAGGSIAMAWSEDGGDTFRPERIAYDDSCECCRIALALDRTGLPVMVFRAIYPGSVRDHAVLALTAPDVPGAAQRVAVDNWKTDACPHHGPSLAVSGAGTRHVAWFTQGQARQGTYYARSQDRGVQFSPPRRVGNPGAQPGRTALFAHAQHVWLAWKEFDGKRAAIMIQESADDGLTWSAPRQVADVTGYSDHPLLVANAGKLYVSWLTTAAGYRLIEVGALR